MNGNSINSIIMQARRRLAPLALGVVCLAASPQALATCDCDTTACDICVESYQVRIVTRTETANCIELEPNAVLRIDPNEGPATLILGDGLSDQTSPICGAVKLVPDLSSGGWAVAVLTFHADKNHTFTGTGSIKGEDENAHIIIPASSTVTIDDVDPGGRVTIKGALNIIGSGTFINDGAVIANHLSGTLNLQAATIDDTAGSGRWQVTWYSTAVLRFLEEPACLDGDFVVSTGTLRAGGAGEDDVDVVTTGDLTQTGGKIEAGLDDSFCFKCDCP